MESLSSTQLDLTGCVSRNGSPTQQVMSERAQQSTVHEREDMFEGLCEFRRWSLFLPRMTSAELERNEAYVRARQLGNSMFFEELRLRLQGAIDDIDVLLISGGQSTAVVDILATLLDAQRVALGFECSRQPHKALELGELSLTLLEKLVEIAGLGRAELSSFTFWRALLRVNLGDAYARHQRVDEARQLLHLALDFADNASSECGPREQVIAGVAYAHLSRICLSQNQLDDAVRFLDMQIEVFERCLCELSDSLEDREGQATALATAYYKRGICEVRRGRQDFSLLWFGKAEECLSRYADLDVDAAAILTTVRTQANFARTIQSEQRQL